MNTPTRRPNVLWAVATPKEYHAAKEMLKRNPVDPEANDGSHHEFFKISRNGSEVAVVALVQCGMSPQTFGVNFTKHAMALSPEYAVVSGVCGTDEATNINLGDVLVCDKAVNYEYGKMIEDNGEVRLVPRYEQHGMSGDVKRSLDTFIQSQEVIDLNLRIHSDLVMLASGSSVRKDHPKLLENMRNNVHERAMGLEMEAAAFFEACESVGVTALGVFKGVSDKVGEKKSDAHYREAAVNATRACYEFCKCFLPGRVQGSLPPPHGPSSQIVQARKHLLFPKHFMRDGTYLDYYADGRKPRHDGATICMTGFNNLHKGLKWMLATDDRSNDFVIFNVFSGVYLVDTHCNQGVMAFDRVAFRTLEDTDLPTDQNARWAVEVASQDQYTLECTILNLGTRRYLSSSGDGKVIMVSATNHPPLWRLCTTAGPFAMWLTGPGAQQLPHQRADILQHEILDAVNTVRGRTHLNFF